MDIEHVVARVIAWGIYGVFTVLTDCKGELYA